MKGFEIIGIAEMMAFYIINHKDEIRDCRIDLGFDNYIQYGCEGEKMYFTYKYDGEMQSLEAKEYTFEEVRDLLLEWAGVTEDEIEEMER